MQARLQRLRLKCRRKHGDIEVLGRALLVKHALPLCYYGFGGGGVGKGKSVCRAVGGKGAVSQRAGYASGSVFRG